VSLSFAKFWLQNCKETHGECRRTQKSNGRLPRRVIHVGFQGGLQEPFLLQTSRDTPPADYVALSHVWGGLGNETITTKRDTLSARCDSIPFATMPLTFQNAVMVCRELGLQYLWIDSLCIIQGIVCQLAASKPLC
jgi:Heterokaryon incompatibility protein (HET)